MVRSGVYSGISNLNMPIICERHLSDYRLAATPVHWQGHERPTLGAGFFPSAVSLDTDATDCQTHGNNDNLDFNNPADATSDADHDGMTSLQEFCQH
jgi:hypothetical protein